METKVTDHYFKFGTVKYFRGNAHNVQLGSFCEKKDPIGPKSYVDVEGKVKAKYLENRIKYNTTADINWNKTSEADVEVNGKLKYFGIGVTEAKSISYSKAKSAKLKLASFAIDERPLKTMLNNDADIARNFLAEEGRDGRIISEVWIVVEAELAEQFERSGSKSIEVEAVGNSISITASGGSSGSQTINLSEGTTFAYKHHKVKDWNKGKTQIEDMEADYYGLQ